MRFLAFLIVFIGIAVASVAGAAWWETQNFTTPGPAPVDTIVMIEPGSSVTAIANTLEKNQIVQSALLFRVGVKRRGVEASLKAGEYSFPARASMDAVLDRLKRGLVIQHKVTIAEGVTSAVAASLINQHPVLIGDPVAEPDEGSLLPETYLFTRGTTRAELLERMKKAQADLIAKLWPGRRQDLPYTTEREALILASIVEKETALASERPRIAAVFVNRMRRGMRLESDPTIIYGLTKGVPLGHGLRQSELARPNPYSTYQIDGLPPTPIANAGKDAIAAVLNPPDSNDVFFVADGTGGHVFAATLSEHNSNVARWRKIERDRAPLRASTP